MYGRSRKSTRSYRGSGSRNYRKPYSRMVKAASYTGRRGTYKTGLKFATVGFTRNVEKKYFDKTFAGGGSKALSGYNAGVNFQGVTYNSAMWWDYDFAGLTSAGHNMISNDMVKTPGNGTGATERIGNKISVKWIKGSFTFTAAVLGNGTTMPVNQGGETLAGVAAQIQPYLRTSIRMVIVKDIQVNSTTNYVSWSDVFGGQTSGGATMLGIHSELKVGNMGRFVILEDRSFTLDSNSPQKNVDFF